jgi:hypothetical protein
MYRATERLRLQLPLTVISSLKIKMAGENACLTFPKKHQTPAFLLHGTAPVIAAFTA